MKLLAATIFIASSFVATASFAVVPPSVVYTFSFAPPSEVIDEGHGISLPDERTSFWSAGGWQFGTNQNYISLLARMNEMSSVLTHLAEHFHFETLYVYEIRPTDHVYSVDESLRFAMSVLPEGAARSQMHTAWLSSRAWTSAMWASTRAIPADQIIGVRRLRMEGDRYVPGDLEPNPNYLFAEPEVSHNPLPIRNASVEAAAVAEDPEGAGFIPGPIVTMTCNSKPQRLSSSQADTCPLPIKKLSFYELYSKTVAKLIATGILMDTTSGQLMSVPGHDEL
ncbi:hypothetical protein N5W20_03650 [Candidatus Kirkpatrickella diaphorinae]|uniref:Pertussis toxin subunit 1 n=1 Tax=Candidatus Kirkpatrickella diaphorinae TaxID=2984322 RepID=A0ABY6GMG8_9PROT|nr:hypothetical protein [Candidatus Kirkpatrickella diaphorinae]UYH51961.1 hypothetical protein N5W20_03650 [Candidatus Kirkpatrickella diaphorinae]